MTQKLGRINRRLINQNKATTNINQCLKKVGHKTNTELKNSQFDRKNGNFELRYSPNRSKNKTFGLKIAKNPCKELRSLLLSKKKYKKRASSLFLLAIEKKKFG